MANDEKCTNASELVCDNWEPVATIRNKGAHRIDGRKVKTSR